MTLFFVFNDMLNVVIILVGLSGQAVKNVATLIYISPYMLYILTELIWFD
jgi:hypothetical protein